MIISYLRQKNIIPKVLSNKILPNSGLNNNAKIAQIPFDNFSFKGKTNYLFFDDFMKKINGPLTQEDIKKVESKKKYLLKKYNQNHIDELSMIIKKNTETLLPEFKKIGIEFEKTEKNVKFADNPTVLDEKSKKLLKKAYIQILAMRETLANLKQTDPLLNKPSFKNWFKNLNYNNKLPNKFDSIYTHPYDKAKYFTGDFSTQNIHFINKKVSAITQKNISVFELEKSKMAELIKIKNITGTCNINTTGSLSNSDYKKLKKSALNYEIYNQALGRKRLFSKEVESIVSNSSSKPLSESKVGDIIDDYGLVLQKTTTYDKNLRQEIPCVVIFNKNQKDYNLNLIKTDGQQEKITAEILKEYEEINSINPSQKLDFENRIIELNQKAKSIIDSEKDLLISKVHFNIIDKKQFHAFEKDINPQIQTPPIESNKFVIIADLLNTDPKRYFKAGRKIVLPLIELLKQNNCTDIFTMALAPNANDHSPLPLYLRAGFKPLSHTDKEVKELTANLKRWDSTTPVFMHLPKDAMVYEILKKEQSLKEINDFKD